MKHCDLSVGDWIIIENCYAYILAVHDIFYETFHTEVQEKSSLKGDYVYSLIVYRIYCTTKGKKINRKPAYFTHGVEDYRSLAPDEKNFISQLLKSYSDEFNNWKAGSVLPSEYEHIDLPVLSSTPKSAMNRFKKAIKQLTSPYTFNDLLKVCNDIKSIDWKHINEVDDNYISFDMYFTIGNHQGNYILFDKIKKIDYTDSEEDNMTLESFFTFETAFLSLARFIKEYDAIYPSEKNTVLLEQLKKIWSGLFHQNWKESPLAFDFFTHAPKIQSYSYELAKDTVLEFLKRNVQELDCQRLVDFLCEEDKEKKVYKKVYELLKGM